MVQKIISIAALRVGLFCVVALSSSVFAGTYPERPIEIICPYPAGTSSDVTTRELATHMAAILKQSVVVINKPGAGGLIATVDAARAKPDGYTLFAAANGTQYINPIIYKKVNYDPFKDFTPISRYVSYPNVLVVNANQPIKNLADLVALAKSRTGNKSLSFGTGGNGTTSHIAGAQFQKMIGADLLNVPYQGTISAVREVVAGRVDMVWGNLNITMPFIQSGKLRPLAISSARRHPLLPDTPTFKEVGYPEAEMNVWSGLVAPAGTPPEIIKKLNRVIVEAVKNPSLVKNYETSGAQPESDASPEAFAEFLKEETDRWSPVIRSLGIVLN
ncbi:Bug family tripartite tricarboxylate transporter substrate binding protein [Candidimonas nitroreducens]|nr:tripartite tricarboxylate transporter substrate binding protein [Candidimonas nitroreducens]